MNTPQRLNTMTDYNWAAFTDAEFARLIRNGAIVAGYDTDFNRAMVEETARRIEARADDVLAEREACASAAESVYIDAPDYFTFERRDFTADTAAAIRARGEVKS